MKFGIFLTALLINTIQNGEANENAGQLEKSSAYLNMTCYNKSLLKEDDDLTCSCCLRNLNERKQLRWIMRYEPESLEHPLVHFLYPNKMRFNMYNGYNDTNKNGCLYIQMTIRRDFEKSRLICQQNDIVNVSVKFPPIKKTIKVAYVRVATRHVHIGSPIRLVCKAQASIPIKKMYLREESVKTYTDLKILRSPLNGYWEFLFEQKGNFSQEFNKLPVQCIAVTKDLDSNKGNVLSPIVKLVGHDIQFENVTFSKQLVEQKKDGYFYFTFRVRISPKPPDEVFYIFPKEEISERTVNMTKKNDSKSQPQLYDVIMKFKSHKFRTEMSVAYDYEGLKVKGPSFFVVEYAKQNIDLQWAIPVIVVLVIILVVFVMLLFAICRGRLSLPIICGRKSNEIPMRENAEGKKVILQQDHRVLLLQTEPNPSTSTEARGNLLRKQIKPYELEKYT